MRVALSPFGMPVPVISPSSMAWMTRADHRVVEVVSPNLGGTFRSSSTSQGMHGVVIHLEVVAHLGWL